MAPWEYLSNITFNNYSAWPFIAHGTNSVTTSSVIDKNILITNRSSSARGRFFSELLEDFDYFEYGSETRPLAAISTF